GEVREKDGKVLSSRDGQRNPPPTATTVRMPPLDDYATVVGEQEIDELHALASRLAGKRLKMVNSTAVGGGVAEILNRLVPLLKELDLPTRWDVITGGERFFTVTKAFHNALHGAPFDGPPEWFH